MHIFIDESGTFAPVKNGERSLSLVGALIVPDWSLPKLLTRYAQRRVSLPKNSSGEVKGKLLDENQVSRVVDLLIKSNCLFEVVAVDMGNEDVQSIERHRAGQAEGITKNLTDKFHPNVVSQLWELRRRWEAMSVPLLMQSVVFFETLAMVMEHAPLYYVQRAPRELANFHWIVDGKGVETLTKAEDWWKSTMCPLLQTRSIRNPMIMLKGADYSHFLEKFSMGVPEYMVPHVGHDTDTTNLGKMLKESFRFSSNAEPGLELVDIVTNATRRALIGNLGEAGWTDIPRLMVHRQEQYIRFITLNVEGSENRRVSYANVLSKFRKTGKSMLTDNGD